jgi:repressor LexA
MKPLDAQEYPAGPLLSVPLLGRIAAGTPVHIPASDVSYYDEESRIDIPVSLIAAKDLSNGLYALEVEGDSMVDAMVYEGDIVILRPEEQVNNGEMVVAWLKDEETTTLKYFYQENGQVRLQPANPDYDPIFISGDALEIQGKVVMVIRSLNRQPL